MAKHKRSGEEVRKRPKVLLFSSLTGKIAFLLISVVTVTLVTTSVFWLFLAQTSEIPRNFDELGRQRMLSMQMVALAQVIDKDSPRTVQELEAAIEEFDEGVELLHGEEQARMPIRMASLTDRSREISELWVQVRSRLEILLEGEAEPEEYEEARQFVITNGPRLAELSDEVVKIYRDGAYRMRSWLWRVMVGAVLLNLLVLAVGVVLVRRKIVYPLRELEHTARQIRRGDLHSRVGARQSDELGILQEAFDEMANEIEGLIETLNKERRFAESLVHHAPAGVIVHRHREVLFANPEVHRLLGVEGIEEIPGRDVLRIFRREDRERARAVITEIDIDAGQSRPLELGISDDFDVSRAVEVVSVPIDYEGQSAVLSVLRDVTERNIMMSKMMQMDRAIAIGTLVAGLGHEINNPLSFVLGNLDFTRDNLQELASACAEIPSEKREECRRVLMELDEAMSGAHLGGERIRDIVIQLQQFSRHEKVRPEPMEVEKALESAITMASGEIRHRAEIVRQYEEVPPVEGNESQLSQIFLNLLVNAAQAIDEGDALHNRITVRVEADGEQVVVEISDTGAGIADEIGDRIFDPFFTTKPPGHGTGLGLALCRQIVESHDGLLTFDSVEGEGTTFRVILPATDKEVRKASRKRSSAAYDQTRRVAFIDDEAEMGEVARRILEPPHEVFTMSDPHEFLDALDRGEHYDIVFCDLMMPNLTGMDLWENLGESHPEVLPKMVFITGGAFTPRATRFLEEVEPRLLLKPFDSEKLKELVAGAEA